MSFKEIIDEMAKPGLVVPDSNPVQPVPIKSLVEKLAEVGMAVGGVEKRGENKDQGYKYVKAADVAKAIRRELFSRGIVILANETAYEERHFETRNGGKAVEARITTQYSITDGSETILLTAYGVGRDNSDKAIYKAKTGCLKYMLRGIALIPDEKEDPETTHIEEGEDEEKQREAHLKTLEPKMKAQQRINQEGVTKFLNAAARTGHAMEEIDDYLDKTFGSHLASDLTLKDMPEAMKWALTPANDLTASMREAVVKVKTKGSRPYTVNFPVEASDEQDI